MNAKNELKEEWATESRRNVNPTQGKLEIIKASNVSKNLTLSRKIAIERPAKEPAKAVHMNAAGVNLTATKKPINMPISIKKAVLKIISGE